MISAVILAAGSSRRMGSPKMLLKWDHGTVLGRVISVFSQSGPDDILVVTGAERDKIEKALAEERFSQRIRTVFNEDFANGEMLSSIKCALRDLARRGFEAAMIGLGDQPQVEAGSVGLIMTAYRDTRRSLIVPSYKNRRGHPWLMGVNFWDEFLDMNPKDTPRDFLTRHSGEILYVNAPNSSILADLDTPEDYFHSTNMKI